MGGCTWRTSLATPDAQLFEPLDAALHHVVLGWDAVLAGVVGWQVLPRLVQHVADTEAVAAHGPRVLRTPVMAGGAGAHGQYAVG